MKKQDKEAEIAVGYEVPGDEWLKNPLVYNIKKRHLELLELIPSQGQLILDAGCGPGTYGIILAQEGSMVIGIDISAQAIQVARDRADKKKIRFLPLVADLENLPFEDNSFDICFCGWTLHHFTDITSPVTELVRVLRPGGKIALVEPNESNIIMRLSRFIEDLQLLKKWVLRAGWDTPNRTIHRHKHYIKALEQHGFTDIKLSSCYPGGLPPLPIKSEKTGLRLLSRQLKLFFHLRILLFRITVRILPQPLNGADLLITGIKKELRVHARLMEDSDALRGIPAIYS